MLQEVVPCPLVTGMVRDAMQHRGCRDWERLDVWSLGDQEADVIPADTGRAGGGLGSEWRSRPGGGGAGGPRREVGAEMWISAASL